MKRCANCDKIVWFWNRFYRKYGMGLIVDGGDENEYVTFCSEKCCIEWKDVCIDFNKKEQSSGETK